MDESSFEGTIVLEKIARVNQLDEFMAAIDSENIDKVTELMMLAGIDEETIAFIMAERLSHENLQSNPSACYVFMEDGDKFVGKRLYLTKTGEENNSELIEQLRRKRHYIAHEEYYKENKYLVYFNIDKVLPLIGSGT